MDNPSGHNWVNMETELVPRMASVVGAAHDDEIAIASSLTTNLHNLMIAFYRPSPERYKIITDGMSFPSDYVSWGWMESHAVVVRAGVASAAARL